MAALLAVLAGSAMAISACGSSDDGEATANDTRDAALASLELTTESAALQSKMAKLVAKLADKPSAAERARLKEELFRLQQRASELIASADADSTFEAELEPLNGSGASGSATLVEAAGEVAVEGQLAGTKGGKRYPLAIHAFKPKSGASVCPPEDAAAGSDEILDASEGADFYGPAAVELADVEGQKGEVELASAADAAKAPPLGARALVLSDSDDTPLACAVPAAEVPAAEETSTAQAIAGTEEIAAAALDAVVVVEEPTSERAKLAERNGAESIESASDHLEDAVEIATAELQEEGEPTAEESEAIEEAEDEVESANEAIAVSYSELEGFIEAEVEAERERQAQREAAAAAAQQAEEEAAAVESAPGGCPPGSTISPSGRCFGDFPGGGCDPVPGRGVPCPGRSE